MRCLIALCGGNGKLFRQPFLLCEGKLVNSATETALRARGSAVSRRARAASPPPPRAHPFWHRADCAQLSKGIRSRLIEVTVPIHHEFRTTV